MNTVLVVMFVGEKSGHNLEFLVNSLLENKEKKRNLRDLLVCWLQFYTQRSLSSKDSNSLIFTTRVSIKEWRSLVKRLLKVMDVHHPL